MNVPMVLGVFAVSAVLVLAFAVATGWLGRGLTSRTEEQEAPELEPLVAGIGVGSAGVPKWLYAAYAVIPLWALIYLVNNIQVRSETVRTEPGAATEARATPSPAAEVPGGPVRIAAKDIEFDRKTFSLLANSDATIVFRNAETTQHNVAIYRDAASGRAKQGALFTGEIFAGPGTREYQLKAPPAGTYYFQCDVHIGMNGTVKVT